MQGVSAMAQGRTRVLTEEKVVVSAGGALPVKNVQKDKEIKYESNQIVGATVLCR